MTDLFIKVLWVMALQRYLGLGKWVWEVCLIALAIDLIITVLGKVHSE